MKIKVSVSGGPEVAIALRGVKAGVANRVLKSAVAKQARKATKLAKSRLKGNGRTGQLQKSIGYIYRVYRSKTVWVYVIGPRKGYHLTIDSLPEKVQKRLVRLLGKRRKRMLTEAQTRVLVRKTIDPVKYAHLVEGGRKAVRPRSKKALSDRATVFGRQARAVGAAPFMRPAATALANSLPEVLADIKAGIEREATKYGARGKSIYAT